MKKYICKECETVHQEDLIDDEGCMVCGENNFEEVTIIPTHKLESLEARSVFELLPAKMFRNKQNRTFYNLGARKTEEQWHKLINQLKKKGVSK